MATWELTGVRQRSSSIRKGRDFRSLFIYDHELASLDLGLQHPFKPERVLKTVELCSRYGVWEKPWMEVKGAERAEREVLERFHQPQYLDILERASRGEIQLETLERGLGTEDCPIVPGLYEWASRAVGGSLIAMRAILEGDADVAFNLFGGFHHGMPDHAEGFCYLNDIAISILEALDRGKRVAYVDMDAHHGNGVQEAFYRDPRVLVISVHETGRTLYPWGGSEEEIGEGEGLGYNVNIPLEPGSDDEVFQLAVGSIVLPLLRAFSPDVLVSQIGADTMISDPLTHLRLTNNSYFWAIRNLASMAVPVLALGGGGYDLYRTARCWTMAWAIFNHVEPRDELAGLVGGMMYGPEMEVGTLMDAANPTKGEVKERAMEGVTKVIEFLRSTVFPIHSL
jgi:acetoin utilization protein AcuC